MNRLDKLFINISTKIPLIKKIRFNVKSLLSKYFKSFVHFISYIKYPNSTFSNHTEITMDGFQRSGNSFGTYLFINSNKDSKIAHHRHINTQIIYSAKNEVPVILFIRKPIDTIISTYFFEDHQVSIKTIIKSWIDFHKPLIKYKKNMVISNFEKTINNFDEVIIELNNKYNTDFKIPNLKKENYKDYNEHLKNLQIERFGEVKLNRISVPNETRLRKKKYIIDEMNKEEKDYLQHANNIFDIFVNRCS